MKKNNDNTNAFLINICGFAGYLYPFGSILTPLIAWQTLKNRSAFLDEQGKEAVNFNISFALYKLILSSFFVPFALGTFFKTSIITVALNGLNSILILTQIVYLDF